MFAGRCYDPGIAMGRPLDLPLLLCLVSGAWLLAGCGAGRPVDTVWAMPDPGAEPGEPRGYPFAYSSGPGVAGADRLDEAEPDDQRGDLPETGMVSPLRFWKTDDQAAWQLARASRRGVFISFYASWCEACVLLERDTLADLDVREAIRERFVPLRIDVTEETRASREQLERYGVYQLPAIVVVDASGSPVDRIGGYLSAEAMIGRLQKPDPAMARR